MDQNGQICSSSWHGAAKEGALKRRMAGGAYGGPGPSVVKEVIYGITLGLIAGGFWKMHHWNYQRRTREFYDLLEKGEISTVVEEE